MLKEGLAVTKSEKAPRTVTREDLYQQIWQTPMSRLAAEYGISGNGLAKICDRLNIPYPPRGYWSKKAAGKKVASYRLPPADDVLSSVLITPTPIAARKPELSPKAQEKLDKIKELEKEISVSERLKNPHPIIAEWMAEREQRNEQARRERDPFLQRLSSVKDFTPFERRRHRILDALFKALERNGGTVKAGTRGELTVEVMGAAVEFQLREKFKQIRRPLTTEEKRWSFGSKQDWKQELVGTSYLAFSIKSYLIGNHRREWLETESVRMEGLLPQIVPALVSAGAIVAEANRKREEEQRLWQLEERKREEERERQRLDDNRWRHLTELAEDWRTVQLTKDFVVALKKLPLPADDRIAGKRLTEWLSWAEERLQSADPLSYGVDGIFESVGEVTAWTYRD